MLGHHELANEAGARGLVERVGHVGDHHQGFGQRNEIVGDGRRCFGALRADDNGQACVFDGMRGSAHADVFVGLRIANKYTDFASTEFGYRVELLDREHHGIDRAQAQAVAETGFVDQRSNPLLGVGRPFRVERDVAVVGFKFGARANVGADVTLAQAIDAILGGCAAHLGRRGWGDACLVAAHQRRVTAGVTIAVLFAFHKIKRKRTGRGDNGGDGRHHDAFAYHLKPPAPGKTRSLPVHPRRQRHFLLGFGSAEHGHHHPSGEHHGAADDEPVGKFGIAFAIADQSAAFFRAAQVFQFFAVGQCKATKHPTHRCDGGAHTNQRKAPQLE